MASPNNFNYPFVPPPPYHPINPPPPNRPIAPPPYHPINPPPPHSPIAPPPPHVHPPPPTPPSPSPGSNTTVIVIVFVSFGGLFFLAFLSAVLCCYIKKTKRKTAHETDLVHVDEHLKVKEAIVEDHHGPKALVLEIEDDVHVDEVTKKNETFGAGLHAKSAESNPSAIEEAASSSAPNHHHHHHIEHRA